MTNPTDVPLKFHWFVPTNGGDGRQIAGGAHGVSAEAATRPASVGYLGQIARSAEQLGLDLNQGSKDGPEVYPHLWADIGLVRGGAGTAMVGSHADIADLIEEYRQVGISEIILSGYPHLEEAYRFGEGVLPHLTLRGLWRHPHPAAVMSISVPFGMPAPARPAAVPVTAS